MNSKLGQAGTEYLIIISFAVFVILSTLGIALFYTTSVQDSIKTNQLDKAARKIIDSAETTYYSGSNALSTVEIFFPEGLIDVNIYPKEIVFNISTQSGINVISYQSDVPLSGSLQPTPHGLRQIKLTANSNNVTISL